MNDVDLGQSKPTPTSLFGSKEQSEKYRTSLFFFIPNTPYRDNNMHIEQQRTLRASLRDVLSPSVEALGLYISGIEFTQEERGPMVRIYIDGDNGVGIADCAKLTREFDPILDVEDPLPDAYTLEVSSPGLDRVLEVGKDFERFKDFHIRIKRVHYKSKLDGVLLGHSDEGIQVQTHVDERFILFEDITQVRLHPTDEEIERIIAGAKS